MWSFPTLSHHCSETTMSMLSLCNTGVEPPHLLAIGGNLGTIDVVDLENRKSLASFVEMHQNNVLGVEFYDVNHLISFDSNDFLYIDLETSNRSEIFGDERSIIDFTFSSRTSPIISLTNEKLYLCDLRTNPVELMNNEYEAIKNICLLKDDNTLIGLRNQQLVLTDIRKPEKFYSLGIKQMFKTINCNNNYLAGVSDDSVLYSLELPLCPPEPKMLMQFSCHYFIKPSFVDDLILIPDSDGAVYAVNPETSDINILEVPQNGIIVSIASNTSEIAVSLEDDIYVFSHFSYEDNLIKPNDDDDDLFNELYEEEEVSDWAQQDNSIVSESGECTYEKYGYCEQQIYVCRTCMEKQGGRMFGICEQCAKNCHDGHDVHHIGIRRRFRCDCGNDIAHGNCKNMLEPKTKSNPHNYYNHNFYEKWCICNQIDDRTKPMVQCICCNDWFHHTCIGFYSENQCIILSEFHELDNWVFVCNECIEKRLTFLDKYPDDEIPPIIRPYIKEMQKDFMVKDNGDPKKEGVGFRILGGRWISSDQFWSFLGKEDEFDKEFGELDTKEEDLQLPKTTKQAPYVKVFRDLYTNLFRQVTQDNRTIIQSSDVHRAFNESILKLMRERRNNNDDS